MSPETETLAGAGQGGGSEDLLQHSFIEQGEDDTSNTRTRVSRYSG